MGADLTGAHLEGANLTRAYLKGRKTKLIMTHLKGATLLRADLRDPSSDPT